MKYNDSRSQQLYDNVQAYKQMLQSMSGRSDYQIEFLQSRYKKAKKLLEERQNSVALDKKTVEESSALTTDVFIPSIQNTEEAAAEQK